MKTLLFLIAVVAGGAIAVSRLVPAERRSRLREGLLEMPGAMMERCMEAMPDDSPPKAMMSSLQRLEEQNGELVTLLRSQNELLRSQNEILQAASAETAESQG